MHMNGLENKVYTYSSWTEQTSKNNNDTSPILSAQYS